VRITAKVVQRCFVCGLVHRRFANMMKRLRRTLSFRSRSKYRANNNPANWEDDSIVIKHGGLSFPAKYLGAVEVTESRGTQVCSNAARQMKAGHQTRKRRVTLWVTEDTLRVIDDITKSLVVDQVIEKVSFCTPDPQDEKLFSYICRDGTTRRWMCHSFRGIKDTGERISHAVGCAFTACLQKKQEQTMKNEQQLQRNSSTRMSKLKERGNANGVVLPQESVQQLQEINQHEYEERLKKAHDDQQIKNTSANTSANDSSLLINGVSPPETKKNSHTFVRPRPTPNADPSPFTRHMSLPYRSRPMGHHAFNTKGSSTYQALTDDVPAPRFQPESSSFQSARLQPTTNVDTSNATAPTSEADMWLATASKNDGLLGTTASNPFSTASATTTATGNAGASLGWNQGTTATPNPFGESNFPTNFPPTTNTQTAQPNPFAVDFRQEQFV